MYGLAYLRAEIMWSFLLPRSLWKVCYLTGDVFLPTLLKSA